MLESITFTGVDCRTDFTRLTVIGKKYRPHVEFGILIGSSTDTSGHWNSTGVKNRYPPMRVVRRFKEQCMMNGVQCALHVCGRYSRYLNDKRAGNSYADMVAEDFFDELCNGFNRVQVNSRKYSYTNMLRFADRLADVDQVVLQSRNVETDAEMMEMVVDAAGSSEFQEGSSISFLHDKSGGRGVDMTSEWPETLPSGIFNGGPLHFGFAGGVNERNILDAVKHVNTVNPSGNRYWIDMETSARDKYDWFDLDAVERILQAVFHEG